jgi:predicted phage terminase large subunit-like protein
VVFILFRKRGWKALAWLADEKRFVKREERAELIETYEKYIEKVKSEYNISKLEQLVDIDPEKAVEMSQVAKELKRLKRVHRSEVDLAYFTWEYFSEAGNPENKAGNLAGFDLKSPDEFADFHLEICDIMNHVSLVEKNAKICVAAPRGHAKSTYLSKSFPCREVVFRNRKYIIAISETPNVSTKNLDWLKTQLKYNEKLRNDFGPLLHPKEQRNKQDNSTSFIAWEDTGDAPNLLTLVEAYSTGQAIRGANWNGHRPDLIICDDLEDEDSNAGTPEQREKLKNWFSGKVEYLGDPSGRQTAMVYMGTTVHPECLLMDILYKRPDFKTKIYRALINPPERQDLWAECESIYKNPELPSKERFDLARQFYEEHKEEMDKGAVVLWNKKSLWDLMVAKWNNSKKFNTELQNNPVDEESQIFNIERDFSFYEPTQKNFKDGNYHIYFGIDFAMGKKERGDYNALTVIAKHKRTGTSFVVESFIEKIHPDQFLDHIVDRVLYWEPEGIAADANVAQEFLTFTLKERLKNVGYPSYTRVKEVKNRTKKELRIEAMKPDIVNGHIQFNRKHVRLLEQFELFPTSHDDGCDSLQMAVDIARVGNAEVIDKPWWM